MLDEDVLDSLRGKPAPTNMGKSNMSLALVYFAALIITLLCSHVDVRISNIEIQINDGDMISNEDLKFVVREFRKFSVPRSTLCIVGWLVACCRFVIMKGNVQLDEQFHTK